MEKNYSKEDNDNGELQSSDKHFTKGHYDSHALATRLILSPDIDTIVFSGIRPLYRYLIQLSVVMSSSDDEDPRTVVVDSRYFDCPLSTPQWAELSRQLRIGRSVNIAWVREAVPML